MSGYVVWKIIGSYCVIANRTVHDPMDVPEYRYSEARKNRVPRWHGYEKGRM